MLVPALAIAAPRGEYQGATNPGVWLGALVIAIILGIVYFVSENMPGVGEFLGGIVIMGVISTVGAAILAAMEIVPDSMVGYTALAIFVALFVFPALSSKDK